MGSTCFLHRTIELCLPDDTVRTLTELLCDCISFVDDKVLVEDLEYFASLEVGHRGTALLAL